MGEIVNFEEGSLEKKLLEGVVRYVNQQNQEAIKDVYRLTGIKLDTEVTIHFWHEQFEKIADYIKENPHPLDTAGITFDFRPAYFNFDQH